jgi:hypothetical protein
LFQEEHRLKVFENKVLIRIFGPDREEVTGELRKLDNEELHNLIFLELLYQEERGMYHARENEKSVDNISRDTSRKENTWET